MRALCGGPLSRWQVRWIVLCAGLSALPDVPLWQWPRSLVMIVRIAWRYGVR